ncbi:glycosyltransferase family 39 protein [Hymenobacter sp. BT175]|uniref:ArnT family glycosyltransferase n=1 Tax=Hymenobacter translucens TaxID=2886507 RepID=UPI001D0F23E0|nr:glycosyltransferase family 39 protein [Hymenobacter translucens]MCC2545875.1 glycosyltransferase family 39 protein [Hymenobacter translucens]
MQHPAPDWFRNALLRRWWWLPLVPAAFFALFWRLGALPLQMWDESRQAVNAAGMLGSGNWLVTQYQAEPDLWNTKPPLEVWLQALSLRTFGYSEWALRLPNALAALLLTVLVAAFARRWLGGRLAGLLAGLALLASKGFVGDHLARSGDFEPLLVLMTTAQVMAVFGWLQTRQRRFLLLAGVAVALALLTKSVAGLFLVPGLAVEVIRRGRLLSLLRQPAAWMALVLALGPPALWYLAREQAGPGYLEAVWQNELGGRLLGSIEAHDEAWYWYLISFVSQKFLLWTPWVLLAGWQLARRPAARPAHRFFTLAAWAGGVFMLLISLARTKLAWYDAPLYPLLALVLGGGLTLLVRRTARAARTSGRRRWLPATIVLLALVPSVIALHSRLNKEYKRRYNQAQLTYGRYLRQLDGVPLPARRYTALHAGSDQSTLFYNAPLEYYALEARQARRDTVMVVYGAENLLPPGTLVVVCGRAAQRALAQGRQFRVVHQADSCSTVRVE